MVKMLTIISLGNGYVGGKYTILFFSLCLNILIIKKLKIILIPRSQSRLTE